MRVLILTPEFEGAGGGIATCYRALAPALRAAGAEVHVIEGSGFHADADRRQREIDGVTLQTLERSRLQKWAKRFPAYGAVPSLRLHLAAAWAMWEQVEFGSGFDVVEAAEWGLSFVPPTIEASVPLFVHCHGSMGQIADHDPVAGQAADEMLVRLIEKNTLALSQVVQTYVRANAEFWRAETGRDVVGVFPAWRPRFSPQAAEPNARGVVVGRLQRWKGPATVCEALQRLGPNAVDIDWYGRDTMWGARQVMASGHLKASFPDVWGARFHFHGQVSEEQVARHQSKALFNIVPSIWDAFNFTVAEAMASGRPTVVSTGAGASELIADGANGFLFTAGDSGSLAAAVERLLTTEPARLEAIGREARATVLVELDPKRVAAKRLDAYTNIVSSFKARRPEAARGWLAAACRPSAESASDQTFLENVPLRALLEHSAARILRKLRPR
jgi:glycosyltransferase involved in cell wall biosynthesis